MDNMARAPKSKVYAIMNWLEFSQAAKYLSELIERRLNYEEMMGLCNDNALPAYMDFSGLRVEVLDDDADAPISYALGKGRGKIDPPLWRNHCGTSWIYATGPATLSHNGEGVAEARFRLTASQNNAPALSFCKLDIERLAADINPLQEKAIHGRERKGIEQIMAVLADMAEIPLSSPYASDEALRAHAATKGLLLPDSPETVVKHLKAAASRTESDRKTPPT